MSMCPVLHELAIREDYEPEYEQTPHLSGGDYDIAAIRDCAESCVHPSYAHERLERLQGLARKLGLAYDDTAHIETALQALTTSRYEWRDKAAAGAARIETLQKQIDAQAARLRSLESEIKMLRRLS